MVNDENNARRRRTVGAGVGSPRKGNRRRRGCSFKACKGGRHRYMYG